jgi:TRAP transporter TAXI family solute receptor
MTKAQKISLKTFVVLVALFILCPTVNAAQTSIAIGTGGTGGGYYPMGGGIATLIAQKIDGVTASAQVTAASLENCKLLQKNDVQMALANAAIMYGYVDKKLQPKEFPGISSIMSTGWGDIITVALKDSPIKSLNDLKGKRIGLGAPGSSTEVINKLILSAHGLYDLETGKLGIKPAYLSFAEMTAGLKDGRLDAAMYFVSGRPAPAVVDLSTVRDIKLIGFDEAALGRLAKKFPFMVATDYPKGLYKGVDYEMKTVLANDVLCCRTDLPTDLVYQITKVIHQNLPELQRTGFHGFKMWSLTRSVAGVFPLHPGAIKYYDEIGLK